jgi:hypothetical protein
MYMNKNREKTVHKGAHTQRVGKGRVCIVAAAGELSSI